jgi:benzoyl-CoA reductase/2-hydroxyglutaryl-CoA dehydratase subunit BcrC/BadD/HgdB
MFFSKKKGKIKIDEFTGDYNFKNRYKTNIKVVPTGSTLEDAKKNFVNLIDQNMKKLQSVPNRPKMMKYFDNIMSSNFQPRIKELEEFKAAGGKIVGTFCLQVPEELIYAAGCIPIRLSCAFYDSISVAEEIIPSNTCPMVRSSIGFPFLKINPFFDMCDVVVIPTTCDGKKKMAEVMSNYKHVWTIELPQDKEHLDARDQYLLQVKLFKERLERLTGKKIPRSNIENSIKLLQKRTTALRDFLEVKKHKNISINGRDTLLAIQTAFNDDIHRWTQSLNNLTNEIRENQAKNIVVAPSDVPRLMITGSPMIWPSWKVLDSIEESGAIIVIDDSCAGSQYFYNTVEVPDYSMTSMLSAIGDKYLLPTVCPIYVHGDDRIDRIIELSSLYKVHGIIYHILRLCTLMDFEYNKTSEVLKSRNVPLLKIETEYGQEDIGQIKTRVEAFIEMIEARYDK